MKTNTSIFKVIFLVLVVPFIIVACSDGSRYEKSNVISLDATGETEAFEAVAVPSAPSSENSVDIALQENVKIIRNATLRMKVGSVEEATRLARKYAAQYAGYVSDERMENNSYSKESRFTIRVPQEYFEIVMESIDGLSIQVDTKNVSTVDVTEEYVDIQSRLKTKREVKERYESILRGRAKTVKEILNAEEKIRVLQEEIEVAEGRLRYLTSNVSYSTIQVDVYETIAEVEVEEESKSSQFLGDVKSALAFGFEIIKTIFVGLLYIWPLILVVGGALFFYYRRRKMKSIK